MADLPIPELGGKTVLQAADKPNLDFLTANGRSGLAVTVPEGYSPGSDVANMSIFGYDPAVYYTGRSPLEALSMGVSLSGNELAFRMNLITVGAADGTVSESLSFSDAFIVDYSGGHITSGEAKQLVKAVEAEFGNDRFRFYPGISYRHLLVAQDNYGKDLALTPPHDITGQKAIDYLPDGSSAEAETYLKMMTASYSLLSAHPVNKKRVSEGKLPANCIWLWGQGNAPVFEPFEKLHGKTGAVISAVDLLKGIGICAGLRVIEVEGATGFLDTNYGGKVDAAKAALKECDFVFVHIEAPDECGHIGDVKKKIQAVEDLDAQVIGPLLEYAKNADEPYRILVMPDHPTPVALKTHTSDPVPFVLYDTREPQVDAVQTFDEAAVSDGEFGILYAPELISLLISGEKETKTH